MTVIRLGTSGWSYKEWEGVFYPRDDGSSKLAFYSKYFKTAEIDSTFYAYPKKAMIQACARVTPDDFVFSAKVPKLITHDKRLDIQKGAGEDLMRFLHDLRPLEDAGKLGPLILQLPPSLRYEDGLRRLIDFFGALPADLKFAVEFRNRSWRRPETWDLLRQCKIANTIVDESPLPPDLVVTADFAVISWHGRGKKPWSDYRYSDAEIDEWALKVKEVEGHVKEVYGYFGNHFRGNAVENSLRMMDKLGLTSEQQREMGARVTRAIQLKAMRYTKPKKTPAEFSRER
ncbi:MAG: DUF72 domain-containing protein [Thaumarchaeota archaeon]|nr:DUF72 domain-containing protein [Nitrososphaerota archaeon]